MGFGFNLAFMFIILPLCCLLLIVWLLSRKIIIGKILTLFIGAIIALALLSSFLRYFTSPVKLKKEDYYGTYVIDRDFYPGEQADWQYDHYRFEIKENDSIYFYHTDGERIITSYKGMTTTTTPNPSARLVLQMNQPSHHILATNPTTYRGPFDFYLVFNSEKFGNVFFRKGNWEK